MTRKKEIFGIFSLSAIAAMIALSEMPAGHSVHVEAADAPYQLLLNASNAPSDLSTSSYNTTLVGALSRYTSFTVLGAKKMSSMFCELESGVTNNYVANVDAGSTPYGITGVTAIDVSYTGGDTLKLYAAYSQTDTYNCIYEFSNNSSKTRLSYCLLRFYKFVNESGSVIDIASISFSYTCAVSSSSISVAAVTTSVNVSAALSVSYSGTTD